MASVRDCPHCPATWMNYQTAKGDFYCRACKKRFLPEEHYKRIVLKPQRNRKEPRKSNPTTIRDVHVSRVTRRIYPLPEEEEG